MPLVRQARPASTGIPSWVTGLMEKTTCVSPLTEAGVLEIASEIFGLGLLELYSFSFVFGLGYDFVCSVIYAAGRI